MPTAASFQRVLDTEADMVRFGPAPRFLTNDETTLIAEALDAGALTTAGLMRRYLEGECNPFQFEGSYAGHLPETEFHRAVAAKREVFFDRIRIGDLRPLVQRINAANRAEAA